MRDPSLSVALGAEPNATASTPTNADTSEGLSVTGTKDFLRRFGLQSRIDCGSGKQSVADREMLELVGPITSNSRISSLHSMSDHCIILRRTGFECVVF